MHRPLGIAQKDRESCYFTAEIFNLLVLYLFGSRVRIFLTTKAYIKSGNNTNWVRTNQYLLFPVAKWQC